MVNKFLLAGDTFMPEMYLKQPGFVDSACGRSKIEYFLKIVKDF